MFKAIGVLAAEHIASGLVESNQSSGQIAGTMHVFPNRDTHDNPLIEMPAEEIVQHIVEQIRLARGDEDVSAVGLGFPGIIRDGVIEDSPNLQQMKGQDLGEAISGHLEGIMGDRAMRLRFLDLEPEEVFAEAKEGDKRCVDFVKLWHRALAAATASSIHLDGPGKFFISGPHAEFVQVGLLDLYLHDMVKMSPLQGSTFEIVPASDELAIVGAAVSAQQSTASPSAF
jgi:predicted NBD/HSP70 family sugar kinase